MVSLKIKFALILPILSSVVLNSVFAKNISDITENKLEFSPVDYETHGEDVAWEYWLKRDQDRFESIRDGWSNFSEKYSDELQTKVSQTDSVSSISSFRDKSFNQKDGSEYGTRIITGTRTSTGISYTANNIKLGGVKLSRINSVLRHGNVEGITVNNGQVFISTLQAAEGIRSDNYSDDFLIIMKSVFESNDGGPWQTIDPPQNKQYQKVYGDVKYSSYIMNTHVGEVMFEADRLMKILGLGYDNRTGKKLILPPWHRTQWDFLSEEDTQNNSANWSRFWFTTEDTIVEIDEKNKVARIIGRPFTVKTEKMLMTGGTLQTSLIQTGNSFSDQWCNFFDKNIPNYQKEFDAFLELERLTRISSILQGLKECGVIFKDIALPNFNTNTASRTAVISALRTRTVKDQNGNTVSTSIYTINLIGGVGMQKIRIVKRDLASYKASLLSDYNKGKLNVERIF